MRRPFFAQLRRGAELAGARGSCDGLEPGDAAVGEPLHEAAAVGRGHRQQREAQRASARSALVLERSLHGDHSLGSAS